MAEEKKPKIDLKARLGKGAAGGVTPPPPAAGIPVPAPGPSPMLGNLGGGVPSAAPAAAPRGGLPVPPGIPVGPPPAFGGGAPAGSLDPSNPLAAAIAPARSAPSVTPKAPPQPQRIEVDEMTVQVARKGARRQGLVMGLVVAGVLGAIGYIAGTSMEASKARSQSVNHAQQLAAEVDGTKAKLTTLAEKLEAGRTSLKSGKFPDTLAKDLSSNLIDFDGSKLAGVRFSGFTTETTSNLIEYISAVQALNDRRTALINLLNKLQKPIQDQLAASASGKQNINFVVLVSNDSAKNPFAILAPLTKPVELGAQMPAEYTATNPMTRANVTAPKLAAADKGGAAYLLPKSLEAACPSESAGQMAQLGSQFSRMISDIRGEKAGPGGDVVVDDKPGLLDRADKLVTGLKKVQ